MSIVQITKNKTGIVVGSTINTDGLEYEQVLAQCEAYIQEHYNFRDRVKFVIGDFLNCLHVRYKHGNWEQIIPDVKSLYNGEQGIATLVNWAAVCDRIPVHIRTGLSFTHHTSVAYVYTNDCAVFVEHEKAYRLYCQRHEIANLHPTSLQCFLLEQGENMSARELHNYKMHILAGKPESKKVKKTPPTQVLRGIHAILSKTLTYTLDNSISAEIRLEKANEVLQSLLSQKIENVVEMERKAQ